MKNRAILSVAVSILCCACSTSTERSLTVIDPGHFHASLVQKHAIEGVSQKVSVYAPEGPELRAYLASVQSYNSREIDPTSWTIDTTVCDDFLAKLPASRKGDVVVLSGKNSRKPEYILTAVSKGYNVLSDKPLAIDAEGFAMLEQAYEVAAKKGLVIYDLMTERYDTLNIVARSIMSDPEKFGKPVSAILTSVHHFCKMVSGVPTKRPVWYYDVKEQGEGIADVTTHLIDILFWQFFPDQCVSDVEVLSAEHYATTISPEQFYTSTGACIDAPIDVFSNGCISFRAEDALVQINVRWDFVAPAGSGDTYEAVLVGTRGTVGFVQDASTSYVRELWYQPVGGDKQWIDIPSSCRLGHEDHFGMVASRFMQFVQGKDVLPEWETVNTLSKYRITTTAVEIANR